MLVRLHRLEGRGLLQRTGDRARGRRNPVQVTEQGRAVLQLARGTAESSDDLGDAGLDAAESAALNRLLLEVAAASRARVTDESSWDWRQP